MQKRVYLNGFQKRINRADRLKFMVAGMRGCPLNNYEGTMKIKYFDTTDRKIAIDFNSKEDRDDFYNT